MMTLSDTAIQSLPTAHGNSRRSTLPAELPILFLWSALGLMLTGLMLVAGFVAEIEQALTAAG